MPDSPHAPTAGQIATSSPEWPDRALLAGPADEICLWMGGPVTRADLRARVDAEHGRLTAAGLRPGGTATLHLPPSLAYVATLLAAWRAGAQVSLLDHRLARAEVDRALDRLTPQILVSVATSASPPMSGYAQVTTEVSASGNGVPAATGHALVQLSSGSTGPSKVIARTSADLLAELNRYTQLPEYPVRGDRIVLLASIVHVLGLVGGLLHSLHAGVQLVFPDRLTADGIRAAVAASSEPTMVLGVPFHAELLCAGAGKGRELPNLSRMVVAGELVRPWVPGAFAEAYGVPLGTMYGMTELGVIATDLSGKLAPAVAPAPGMRVRLHDGELQVAQAASPYIGLIDPTRWSDGWLSTRDAAVIDPDSGLVTIRGRLDSQVAIGGLKVDLTEVEQTLSALPQVSAAVITYRNLIEAYLVLADGATVADVEAALADQLAPFKRPRRIYALAELPRTATGKVVRDRNVLEAAARAAPAVAP